MQRWENMRIQVGKVVHEEEAPQLPTASSSAKNKGRSTVNYRQSSAFDCTYLSCNDHCDRWLFQEIFFIIIIS